jgi:formate/nitrite transporter FocA (FNT family)
MEDLLRNWTIAYAGNMLGCLLISLVANYTGILTGGGSDMIVATVMKKLGFQGLQAPDRSRPYGFPLGNAFLQVNVWNYVIVQLFPPVSLLDAVQRQRASFSSFFQNPYEGTLHVTSWRPRKCSADFGPTLVKGVMCNWLICLAVWLCTMARGLGGKMIGAWFPISMFVAIGFEHSVTNMFILPAGLLAGVHLGNDLETHQ